MPVLDALAARFRPPRTMLSTITVDNSITTKNAPPSLSACRTGTGLRGPWPV
jgi:hypothetical protein